MFHTPGVAALRHHAKRFDSEAFHLKHLIRTPGRLTGFSCKISGMFFDYSRQRLDAPVMAGLMDLARETSAMDHFAGMVRGDVVNTTENRPALHTATRAESPSSLVPESSAIFTDIQTVRHTVRDFARQVHQGRITSGTGQVFTDAVVVGIGGSYLGCEFVYQALQAAHRPRLRLHFLSNVDIDNFGQVVSRIPAETCLWIIISKSYTTTETMANLAQTRAFLSRHGLSPKDHLITVTAKGSPGDDPANPVLASFHMFDFIGGRYSVSSAVGAVPLSLAFGPDIFDRFLHGCHEMDIHALESAPEQNLPLVAALISIWNTLCLGYTAQAIIPYAAPLSRLAPHVQQLSMESLGKSTDRDGIPLPRPVGTLVFGEPGTNAQHSFFQLAHQGPAFPIDFIGVLKPGYTGDQVLSKGVSNHQELWANLIAQTLALALGRDHRQPARSFSGNRPSSLLVLDDLSAESVGRLLAFYEARTVFEGFIMGINPFDQFGVELGKVLASEMRPRIAAANDGSPLDTNKLEPAAAFYLEALLSGRIG